MAVICHFEGRATKSQRRRTATLLGLLLTAVTVQIAARRVEAHADAVVLIVDASHPDARDDGPGTAESPFRTISRAVAAARPGTTVLVKAGVYREQVEVTVSGEAGSPITIQAALGERVIISGSDVIQGWKRCTATDIPDHPGPENVWYVDLPTRPFDLYFDGVLAELTVANWPRDVPSTGRVAGGYYAPVNAWPVEDGSQSTLIDIGHLLQPEGFWDGGELQIIHFNIIDGRFRGDARALRRIDGYDPERHEIRFSPPYHHSLDRVERGEHRQWYSIQNLPSLIRGAGEFSCQQRGDGFRLHLWPPKGEDLAKIVVEGSVRKHCILGEKAAYINIQDLEVRGSLGSGIRFRGGNNNHVLRCTACYCRSQKGFEAAAGFEFQGERDSSIRNCLSLLNAYGVMQSGCQSTRVEENAIGQSVVDGINLSWHSRDVHVKRNYIFDAWDRGHPDGLQTYRDLQGLRIEDNLLLSVGQGFQCAETQDSIIRNNFWIGIHYNNAVSCSLRKNIVGDVNRRNRFEHNTFFEGDVGSGGESHFLNNIVMPPSGGGARSEGNVSGKPIKSDYNLLFTIDPGYMFQWDDGNKAKQSSPRIEDWAQATQRNLHSKFAPPKFRNGPAYQARVGEGELGGQPTIKLRRTAGFAVGDFVEIDVDGVVRKVTALGDGTITVDPPAPALRGNLSFVWNWKQNSHFDGLDMRLADGSAGRGMCAGGEDPGADLDIQAYMRGDFNGDGKADLPPIAACLKDGNPRLARFARW